MSDPKQANTAMTRKRRRIGDTILYGLIYLSAIFSVFLLIGIILYIFVKGAGQVNAEFLTSVTSALKGTVGIAGNIVNTLYIIVLTMIIATPIGVGAAIYLNEYANRLCARLLVRRRRRWVTRSRLSLSWLVPRLSSLARTMAGIPI